MDQREEFKFQNVAYRPTVYKTGVSNKWVESRSKLTYKEFPQRNEEQPVRRSKRTKVTQAFSHFLSEPKKSGDILALSYVTFVFFFLR